MNDFITETARGILAGGPGAGLETARVLMEVSRGQVVYDLLYWANRIRLARVGPQIRFCAIAAGKIGACTEDCAFCGQSSFHVCGQAMELARLTDLQIVQAAQQALQRRASSFGIVNSGRGPSDGELDELAGVLEKLVEIPNLTLCASLGILSDAQARRLVSLGVKRYNHNLETSRRFFPNVISTHSFEDRLNTAQAVKRAGMSLCCGGIFGMGETVEDRLDLAQTLAELEPDEVPMNFLHPLQGTPLAGAEPLKPLEILRTIAVFRFMLPDAQIKVAGGRELNLRDLQSWMFFSGASGCLIGNYLLTSGRSVEDDLQMLTDLELPTVAAMAGLAHEVKG